MIEKKLIAFDIDQTLTKSRSLIDSEMADIIRKLLTTKKVGIISGESFLDIKKQILDEIGFNNDFNKNLVILPTNGGSLWIFDGSWKEISSHLLTLEEKEEIIKAIKEVDQEDLELRDNVSQGREIQDRESQITYAALGVDAPVDQKHNWDPDFKKRIALQDKLMKKLPKFEVKIGGSTSIDITPKGMDKAYAMTKLLNYLSLNKEDAIFFGDAVYEHGNDYPVFLMGVETIKVADPEDTKVKLIKLLKNDTI
jgi:phosphomannomutase